jgi:hypothetical protein
VTATPTVMRAIARSALDDAAIAPGELCSVCATRIDVRRVAVVHRETGAPGELLLCGRCRSEPDRTWRKVWAVADSVPVASERRRQVAG